MTHTTVQYKRSPFVPVFSEVPRGEYILTVRDLPHEEKPREKLQAFGPLALSVPELFAIVFTNGTKKEDVLSMSSRIVKEYGEKSILNERNPKRLAESLNIPIVKATQIIAVIELGRRFFEKKKGAPKEIRTAKDVFQYTSNMRDLPKEHLRGIYLNSHYKIIYDEVISIGTIDASIIHPREVFRPALEHGAAAVILVHNHPSGVLIPSAADVAVTRQLLDAAKLVGIEMIDHVIVANGGYTSIMSDMNI